VERKSEMKKKYHKVTLYCRKCKKDYSFNALEGFEQIIKSLRCEKNHFAFEVKQKSKKVAYEVDFIKA
jgi:hypothetical protein